MDSDGKASASRSWGQLLVSPSLVLISLAGVFYAADDALALATFACTAAAFRPGLLLERHVVAAGLVTVGGAVLLGARVA